MGIADANEADKDDLGLGQDFTFILLAAAGVRYAINDQWSAWLGGMWHHLSNNDLSEPDKRNIGLDEFGVVLGAGYSFRGRLHLRRLRNARAATQWKLC